MNTVVINQHLSKFLFIVEVLSSSSSLVVLSLQGHNSIHCSQLSVTLKESVISFQGINIWFVELLLMFYSYEYIL